MRLASGVAVLAVLLASSACGGDRRTATADSTTSGGSASSSVAATTPATASSDTANGACPATGQWALCSIMKRLDQSGLAPRRDSAEVRMAPLTRPGVRVALGSSEVDLFLYPDEAARKRDESLLDRKRFIEATEQPTLRGEATLIRSANLLAILRSRSDTQRERVYLAITAGPPQPAQPPAAVPIPASKTPR